MGPNLNCPQCGRSLSLPTGAGEVVCDGCELRFDPSSVRHEEAPPWKSAIGSTLIALGVLFFLGAFQSSLTTLDARDSDSAMKVLGLFLLPVVAVLGGLAMLRGTFVIDESDSQTGDSTPDPETYNSSEVQTGTDSG
jgi:hypothetical protein